MYEGHQVFYPKDLYPDTDVVQYCQDIKQFLINNNYITKIKNGEISEKKLKKVLDKNISTNHIINTIITRFSDSSDPENQNNQKEAIKAFEEKKHIVLNHIENQYRDYRKKILSSSF